VAGILFCAARAWKGSIMTWQAWQHNDRMSTSLGTPMFIPYLLLPLGFILLGLQYAILLRSGLTPQPKEAQTEQQI
jgi:TRAP-type C4-dicarboxylate transport system permease small subunit